MYKAVGRKPTGVRYLFGSASLGGAVVAALGDTRRLAGAATQIIELRATHGALADHFDRIDVRRIEREDALDAFTERNLPHGEVGAHALVRARDAHALVILNAGALAFNDLHANAQRITGTEVRNFLGDSGNRFRLNGLQQVHMSCLPSSMCAPEAGQSRALL